MIDEQKLAEWERLANEATEGPWYEKNGSIVNDYFPILRPIISKFMSHKDAKFIAMSRDAVPELIKTVRDLEGIIKQTCSFCCGWLEMKCSTAKGDKCPVYKRKVEKDVQDD